LRFPWTRTFLYLKLWEILNFFPHQVILRCLVCLSQLEPLQPFSQGTWW
jgi:hypothetical protein